MMNTIIVLIDWLIDILTMIMMITNNRWMIIIDFFFLKNFKLTRTSRSIIIIIIMSNEWGFFLNTKLNLENKNKIKFKRSNYHHHFFRGLVKYKEKCKSIRWNEIHEKKTHTQKPQKKKRISWKIYKHHLMDNFL